ncbi:MAG: TIGR03619 family F420-dependent LLM class oxidoreductase [Proteobacteria bacterium]|nr:TIGR03619 family F420-dependent LLM class oxidoreductase [Pseudomonadota bacterium]
MEIGFFLPTRGPLATLEGVRALARRGEDLGFDIIGVPDHIVIPTNIAPHYPYSDTGEFPGGGAGDCLDQLALLAFLAGQTSKVRLLTSIMVVPHRPAVLAAKMLATADLLSGGRVIVGCGVGWMREEFEAIGAPPFDERGAVTDEYIRAFRELWTRPAPAFDGRYVKFSDISFLPQPIQKPHPPIWIGGESAPAMKRAARLGDGWYPIGSNPRYPLDSLERYRGAVARLHRYAEACDRDPAGITLAYCALRWSGSGYGAARPEAEVAATDGAAGDGGRRLLTGAPEQVAGDIDALEDLGVRHLVLNFQSAEPAQTLESMERFAREVRPLVAG